MVTRASFATRFVIPGGLFLEGAALALCVARVASAQPSPRPTPETTTAMAAEKVDAQPAVDTVPDPLAARRGEAEAYRLRALRLYDTGNFSAARAEFLHANQILPSFRLLYNLGVVSMALGDSAAAYDYFTRFLAEGASSVSADVRTQVELQLRDLADHVAILRVRLTTAGAKVFVDDTLLGVAPLAQSVRVNAGSRKVWAMTESGSTTAQTVELRGGDTRSVELKILLTTPPVVPPRKPIFWLGWGSTAVLAAGATFAGFNALSAHHQYEDELGSVDASRDELDKLDARATRWSVTADVLAGAAVVTGIYSLYVTLRRPPSSAHGATAPASPSATRSVISLTF